MPNHAPAAFLLASAQRTRRAGATRRLRRCGGRSSCSRTIPRPGALLADHLHGDRRHRGRRRRLLAARPGVDPQPGPATGRERDGEERHPARGDAAQGPPDASRRPTCRRFACWRRSRRAIGRNEDAEKLLERCLELAPGFTPARYNYAVLLHRLNDPPRALAEIERLLAADPRNPSYRNLHAVMLSRRRRVRTIERHLRQSCSRSIRPTPRSGSATATC